MGEVSGVCSVGKQGSGWGQKALGAPGSGYIWCEVVRGSWACVVSLLDNTMTFHDVYNIAISSVWGPGARERGVRAGAGWLRKD